MVVVLDLGEDNDAHGPFRAPHDAPVYGFQDLSVEEEELSEPEDETERENPNLNAFSAALSCYPVVSELAKSLDLNSLHELSRTCRQIRANLLQYRRQLIASTLRCANEEASAGTRLGQKLREANDAWHTYGPNGVRVGKITSGKVGACARDMVGECRRCGTAVCRNCVVKAPSTAALRARHRRLCRTCNRCPIDRLTITTTPKTSTTTSTSTTTQTRIAEPDAADTCRFVRARRDSLVTRMLKQTLRSSRSRSSSFSSSTSSYTDEDDVENDDDARSSSSSSDRDGGRTTRRHRRHHRHTTLARSPCRCPEQTWLCQPCGHHLRSHDTVYARGWTWRTRYSTYLGGLGTGIGEGHEGVTCGRAAACLAAVVVEKEIDCDAAGLETLRQLGARAVSEGRQWSGTGFGVAEIEGVGGVMKKKVKKRVRVGAVVKEYEDERDGGGAGGCLAREADGVNRSWCAWCERVVLSRRDRECEGEGEGRDAVGRSLSGSTSSSGSSV